MRETFTRLRYRYWPDHLVGEILSKRWTETAIPVIVLFFFAFALTLFIHIFLPGPRGAPPAGGGGVVGFRAAGEVPVVTAGGSPLLVASLFSMSYFPPF